MCFDIQAYNLHTKEVRILELKSSAILYPDSACSCRTLVIFVRDGLDGLCFYFHQMLSFVVVNHTNKVPISGIGRFQEASSHYLACITDLLKIHAKGPKSIKHPSLATRLLSTWKVEIIWPWDFSRSYVILFHMIMCPPGWDHNRILLKNPTWRLLLYKFWILCQFIFWSVDQRDQTVP